MSVAAVSTRVVREYFFTTRVPAISGCKFSGCTFFHSVDELLESMETWASRFHLQLASLEIALEYLHV